MNRRENTGLKETLAHCSLRVDQRPGIYHVYHKKGEESATESEWSPECVCAVNMTTAMSRTPIPQTHGSGKAFLRWDSKGWQGLPHVQIWMLTVCTEILIVASFLPSFTRGSQPEDSYCIESTPTKISQTFLTSFFTHKQYLCLLVQLYLISTLSLKSTVLPQLHQRECLPPNPAFLSVSVSCHFFIPFPPLVKVLESKPEVASKLIRR